MSRGSGTALFAAALVLAPQAAGWPPRTRGEPPRKPDVLYRVWLDANGQFRVVFGEGDGGKTFVMRVVTDGHFEEVAATGPDGKKLQVEKTAMHAELRSSEKSGALRLEIDQASRVTFFLLYGGLPVAPRRIAIGAEGSPPESNPFTVQRDSPPAGARHGHAKGDHHHHAHDHPHDSSDHHHHAHPHPHEVTHGHHPH